MGKRGQVTPLSVIGPADDPGSLYHQMQQFLQWMRERNYSYRTTDNREVYLRYFILWCDERGLVRPQEITRPILERYQRYMFLYRKKDGQPLSTRSQATRVTPIRAWFKWLTKTNRILYNPASDLDLPRMEHRLPRHILTAAEADRVLNVPDITTATGLRDRAILETLYSTGIRRMEILALNQFDIDIERGTMMVRQGKGKKDRMIPIGERALAWIQKYRDDVRSELAPAQDDGTLFLTQLGEPFTPNRLTQMVRDIIDAAKINKRGSCHLFRHTMATLMLENGADIRFIQAMLGHVELKTTQIYTQVSIVKLKEIHTLTHPARLERLRSAGDADAQGEAEDAASDLLAALEAEADEEEPGTGGA
ncbi:site-specific tyrosine recombinase XerC [Massilia sp. DJPM01]|uniref:site-specific tyrosine recombinase XerC n=1 Tax=Massilia sp. DJPM01 TaxID=3024404 RepID=UPI00259E4CF5|nr:site-specific tyrosine recombinase XerC [Massilia sp. DJPM01]MDM5182048.1 site-specific tyrosine recombinase XerC [Massilia sp. DJPM01]